MSPGWLHDGTDGRSVDAIHGGWLDGFYMACLRSLS